MPLPLEPLQILILNLFTDGIPGASLSMEKGDPHIMDDEPRPKTQPLIHGRLWQLISFNAIFIASGTIVVAILGFYWNFGVILLDDILAAGAGPTGIDGKDYTGVTCNRWEGPGNGWRVYGTCAAKFGNGSSVFPGLENMTAYEDANVFCRAGEYECLWDGVARAQTMTFISICMTEVFRAFTIRSFTASMLVGMFSNKHLVGAVVLSFFLTVFVTNTPVVMKDVFGFAYISFFQWFVSFLGAFNAVFWSELMKWIIRIQDRTKARWDRVNDNFDAVLTEIRHVRAQLDRHEK